MAISNHVLDQFEGEGPVLAIIMQLMERDLDLGFGERIEQPNSTGAEDVQHLAITGEAKMAMNGVDSGLRALVKQVITLATTLDFSGDTAADIDAYSAVDELQPIPLRASDEYSTCLRHGHASERQPRRTDFKVAGVAHPEGMNITLV